MPAATRAQPRNSGPYRVAVLEWESAEASARRFAAFREAVVDNGPIGGRDVRITLYHADTRMPAAEALARQAVAEGADVIVAFTTPAAHAAQRATERIPILFSSADPIRTGLVRNLAHPGGNMTGVSLMLPELEPKRIGLLHETLPHATRIAYLAAPSDPAATDFLDHAKAAATRLGLAFEAVFAGVAEDSAPRLAEAQRNGAQALVIQPLFTVNDASARRVAEVTLRLGLPATGVFNAFADRGGLMSFGPPIDFGRRRLVGLLARVLTGTPPGEIPVEQPTEFEFVLNLGTARRLGLSIPPAVLARADRVVD